MQLFSMLPKVVGPALGSPGANPTFKSMTAAPWQDPARGLLIRVDPQRFQGTKRVAGTVNVITTPAAARRVRLYDRVSGVLARETWSDGSGAYAFNGLDGTRIYCDTAFDNAGGYNATIEDFVVPG